MNPAFVTPDPAGRAQFVADIGRQISKLDAGGSKHESLQQAIDELQRCLMRVQLSMDDIDYLDARRHLLTLIAEGYRTARDCRLLTDDDAVAATDAAPR